MTVRGDGVPSYMAEWPFTDKEWDEVKASAMAQTNAVLQNDTILHRSSHEELKIVIGRLMEKYGPHRVLVETLRDYAELLESCLSDRKELS